MARMKLAPEEATRRVTDLAGWTLAGPDHAIEKEWRFEDYAHAMLFANAIAHLAEQHDHHPDMTIGYGFVRVQLSTHDAGGLTSRDFELASAIDRLPLHEYVKE